MGYASFLVDGQTDLAPGSFSPGKFPFFVIPPSAQLGTQETKNDEMNDLDTLEVFREYLTLLKSKKANI